MLKAVLVVLGIVVLAGVCLVAWLLWAARSGARNVYLQLTRRIAPVEDRLASGQDPEPADVERFAQDRETRMVLYDALQHHDKLQFFPAQYATPEAMAEGDLVLWLCHPNELGAAPDEIQLMARVPVPGDSSSDMRYYVFRYRTKPPHWAAKDGWLAGVAGPYPASGTVSAGASGTFSRFESYESRTPEEHVRVSHESTSSVR